MGIRFSSKNSHSAGVATAVSLEIAAPAETVWAVVTDLDALPDVVSYVTSVERIEGTPQLAVGTKWRETRYDTKSKTMQQIKTIIGLSQQDPYSMSVNISFVDDETGNLADVANTNTMTVQSLDNKSCVLICSLAFLMAPNILLCICSKCLQRVAEKYVIEELQDYAKEALKRNNEKKEPPG